MQNLEEAKMQVGIEPKIQITKSEGLAEMQNQDIKVKIGKIQKLTHEVSQGGLKLILRCLPQIFIEFSCLILYLKA